MASIRGILNIQSLNELTSENVGSCSARGTFLAYWLRCGDPPAHWLRCGKRHSPH